MAHGQHCSQDLVLPLTHVLLLRISGHVSPHKDLVPFYTCSGQELDALHEEASLRLARCFTMSQSVFSRGFEIVHFQSDFGHYK